MAPHLPDVIGLMSAAPDRADRRQAGVNASGDAVMRVKHQA